MQALIISKTFGMCDGFSDFGVKENVLSFSLSMLAGITGKFSTALWGETEWVGSMLILMFHRSLLEPLAYQNCSMLSETESLF